MEITLSRATIDNAQELHAMQVESFKELLEKYQDFDTNPGNESMEKVAARLKQDFTFYYFICIGQQKVGAIRIIDKKENGKNKHLKTTKKDTYTHGYGIASVRRVVEKYNGTVQFTDNGTAFEVSLMMYGIDAAGNEKGDAPQ